MPLHMMPRGSDERVAVHSKAALYSTQAGEQLVHRDLVGQGQYRRHGLLPQQQHHLSRYQQQLQEKAMP
jgi:hypothetical protein